MKRTKKWLLLLAAGPVLMAWGCDGGFWNMAHQAGIHISELTQWLGALNQLGITTT